MTHGIAIPADPFQPYHLLCAASFTVAVTALLSLAAAPIVHLTIATIAIIIAIVIIIVIIPSGSVAASRCVVPPEPLVCYPGFSFTRT